MQLFISQGITEFFSILYTECTKFFIKKNFLVVPCPVESNYDITIMCLT